jgi:short-subunit dehydrogenase
MRGFSFAIPYCASKAFMRGYMQGLRHESAIHNLGITITDIRPGFVNTSMIKNQKGLFWVSPVQKAAVQIVSAINKKKKWAYISKRWELIGLICKFLPDAMWHNLKVNNY